MTVLPIKSLLDGCGRAIDTMRISVTDRCDFRCTYCMAPDARFLARDKLLSRDELIGLARHFVARGIRRIRLSGGEPLVRRDIMDIVMTLGAMIGDGLDELTITTNGSQLARHAGALHAAGIRRINVSLDTLDPARFAAITRGGRLDDVLAGIAAARAVGLAIRINCVAMRGVNDDEAVPLAAYCVTHGFDLAVIEAMPLGPDLPAHRGPALDARQFIAPLLDDDALLPLLHRTSGPARYYRLARRGLRIGLITPMTANFCDGCNRIRLTAEGKLHPCLGHATAHDFRSALRDGGGEAVDRLIDTALRAKPARHDFVAQAADPAQRLVRTMNVTGG